MPNSVIYRIFIVSVSLGISEKNEDWRAMKLSVRRVIISCCCLLICAQCGLGVKENRMKNSEAYIDLLEKNITSFDDVIKLFPKTTYDITHISQWSIDHVKNNLEHIRKISAQDRTFENTARLYDMVNRDLSVTLGTIELLELVSPDKNIRDEAHKASISMRNFFVEMLYDVTLYRAFQEYLNHQGTTEKLTQEEHYFLQETMRDFKRNGLHLPAQQLEKLKQLKQKNETLASEFELNIAQDNKTITIKPDALPGVSADFLAQLPKDKDGNYILKNDHPTYIEIREHCSNAQTRKTVYRAVENRAYPKNMKVLEDLIAVGDKRAALLGFDSYAALSIDGEMAKTVDQVEEFLENLGTHALKKADKELSLFLKDLPEGVSLTPNGLLHPWDIPYLKSQYKKKHFDIDERAIAEYFPVEKTIQGIFDIYQKFLGLIFKLFTPAWAWHPDVRVIEVHDLDNNLRGYIIIDLYPRDNKYNYFCQAGVIPTLKTSTNKIIPCVGAILANFPKAQGDKPALLNFDNVKTFFHEFGHAMHFLLGATSLASFSGTTVKRDFVEVPSQMFEEWMYDKSVLQKLSGHYKTGQGLPDEFVDKLIALKKFDSGLFVQRQCCLSFTALELFKKGEKKDTDAIVKAVSKKYMHHTYYDEQVHFQAGFGHLSGYGARYYSYMWSKVFSLDLFYKIRQHGLLNPKIGQEIIGKVLGMGGSADPNKLLKDFLGRSPTQEAFMNDLGFE